MRFGCTSLRGRADILATKKGLGLGLKIGLGLGQVLGLGLGLGFRFVIDNLIGGAVYRRLDVTGQLTPCHQSRCANDDVTDDGTANNDGTV